MSLCVNQRKMEHTTKPFPHNHKNSIKKCIPSIQKCNNTTQINDYLWKPTSATYFLLSRCMQLQNCQQYYVDKVSTGMLHALESRAWIFCQIYCRCSIGCKRMILEWKDAMNPPIHQHKNQWCYCT